MTVSEWLDYFGLVFVVLLLIPNIFVKIESRQAQESRALAVTEQIGRYACIVLMIFRVPGTWFGYPSGEAFALSLIVNTILSLTYCVLFVLLRKRDTLARAILLSVLPSLVFLIEGAASLSIPLTVAALLFAGTHITISVKNAKYVRKN